MCVCVCFHQSTGYIVASDLDKAFKDVSSKNSSRSLCGVCVCVCVFACNAIYLMILVVLFTLRTCGDIFFTIPDYLLPALHLCERDLKDLLLVVAPGEEISDESVVAVSAFTSNHNNHNALVHELLLTAPTTAIRMELTRLVALLHKTREFVLETLTQVRHSLSLCVCVCVRVCVYVYVCVCLNRTLHVVT